uniref:Lymphocyte cytosolic protein 2 n=1 Tax=Cyanoderma ruficeps TaxID=181631 RepID=A0A8C3XDA6_9PASS
MDQRNVPYRSEVLTWEPDDLAEYFRTLKYKDCEKVVRKHSINGQRFLVSEGFFLKLFFFLLSNRIVSKLSQEINKNEGRAPLGCFGFFLSRCYAFGKAAHAQKCVVVLLSTGYAQDDGGWSSFDDDDDYESPDEDQEKDDEADYESPTEEPEEAEHDSDGYEPPPSNNDEAHHNVIFPAKSLPSSTDYIDRPSTTRTSHQPPHHPPVPPQRPGPAPGPASFGGRSATVCSFLISHLFPIPGPSKESKTPAPSIDRSTKPSLDRLAPPYERESPGSGKKPGIPEKLFAFISPSLSCFRSLGEQLAMMPKPPVPPSDRYERGNPPPLRKQTALQRPVPQLSLPPYSSNAFPPKSVKPPPKPVSNSIPAAERFVSPLLVIPFKSQSLGSNSRSPSRGPADTRPPLPIPSRQTVHQTNTEEDEGSLKDEWYVAFVSRPEAEAALRRINKDGTFLVRDSSRKTVTHPYVLMVLYRDKVYNIQIRYQEHDHLYLLGTSLKGKEEFSSVADIIDHFQRTPLLLIDGKDRGSRNQCMLKYAAGHI